MQVTRLAEAQQFLEVELARGRVQQVGAAHHLVDALPGVVQDHRQLIGVEAVAPANDEVAHFAAQVLAVLALHAVDEVVFQLRHANADGRVVLRMLGVAAEPRVDALAAFQLLA
ncbi:hypothetical protein D9M69_696460 [compost metagenome]